MCTVTFIPVKDSIYITSSRDEKNSRKNAAPPSLNVYAGKKMIYPTDGNAGGSWIAMKENGDIAVLLNGAFFNHIPQPPYRKSRGKILLDILAGDFPTETFLKTKLSNIEPFTIIAFEQKQLYEFRWDGNEKFYRDLPADRDHIWSSATLYDELTIKKRETWFSSFIKSTAIPTQLDILNFHKTGGEGDKKNDFLMQREGAYSTVSITGIMLNADRGLMKYIDLKNNRNAEMNIRLSALSAPV